jgi:hypothetical protein
MITSGGRNSPLRAFSINSKKDAAVSSRVSVDSNSSMDDPSFFLIISLLLAAVLRWLLTRSCNVLRVVVQT